VEQTASVKALSMTEQARLDMFTESKPRLMGLAYRILGTVSEAEDAVQDTYVRWLSAQNAGDIREPLAWLNTVCTRRCLDMLKAANKARVNYVGTWLPEPLHDVDVITAEDHLELSSSLTTAFLLLLERLTPKERAAYLLHEVFDSSYAEISKALTMEEAACRQLVSRAKRHVGASKVRSTVSHDMQSNFVLAFQNAIDSGDTQQLETLLTDDVTLCADSGGKVVSISRNLSKKKHVLKFIRSVLSPAWGAGTNEVIQLNGQLGFVIHGTEGGLHAAVSFSYSSEDGIVSDIFIMRNPDKLERLAKKLMKK